MKTRRDRRTLQRAVDEAATAGDKAAALYEFAVFHDNNGREAEAIPHYESALELGLDPSTKVRALAWLASSLYKTGSPEEALARVDEALAVAEEPELIGFLERLRWRAGRAISGPTREDRS